MQIAGRIGRSLCGRSVNGSQCRFQTSSKTAPVTNKVRPDQEKLIIFDTTLRDGEQSPGVSLNVEEKLMIARQLSKLGVDVCEAGFPIASEGDFEAVSRIAKEVGVLVDGRASGKPMTIAGLARATEKDIKTAFEAVRHAPNHRIHTFLATSDIHLKYKLQCSREECFERAVKHVAYARSLCADVEFSPEDAGRSDMDFLCQVLAAVIEAGATTLNIPDTVGYNTPQMYGDTMRYLIANTKGAEKVIWSTHCHNDLGLATANTMSAVHAGARQVEVTINGIGERAGNTSLEEVAMILYVHKHDSPVYTDIAHKQITRTSQLVAACTGMHVQPNKAVVGANAFAHESGIHQDGMLKNASTYEIINPEVIGLGSTTLILGKHSGRHAFTKRLGELGYDNLSENELQSVFTRFKKLTDTKKVVSESDLHALLADEVTKSPEKYKLAGLQVQSGMALINTATVTISGQDGEQWTDAAIGNGPVDSVFQTIERIIGCPPMTLTEFDIKAITPGTDAQGSVTVRIRETGDEGRANPAGGLKSYRSFMGHGTDTDIIQASGKAYLDAINRYLAWKESQGHKHTMGIPEYVDKKVAV